jgi:hypothetical protein
MKSRRIAADKCPLYRRFNLIVYWLRANLALGTQDDFDAGKMPLPDMGPYS